MARARNIKPGFFRNEELAELEPLTRLLFAGLWTIADRAGRLEDRPKRIKADVLPYDECDVDPMLDALAERSFIARYMHGAARYIQVINFDKHQNPHKNEAGSDIPAFDEPEDNGADDEVAVLETVDTAGDSGEHGTSTVQAPESHSTTRADSLNTDSLIPEDGGSTPTPPARAKSPNYSEPFLRFCRAYPTGHVEKKPAWEQWRRLAPDDATQAAIMTGLDAWKASDRWQRGYIKEAFRWLRDRSSGDPPPAGGGARSAGPPGEDALSKRRRELEREAQTA